MLKKAIFIFPADVNECQSHPCQNGANCTDKINGYLCMCVPGFVGINCEIGKSFKITIRSFQLGFRIFRVITFLRRCCTQIVPIFAICFQGATLLVISHT